MSWLMRGRPVRSACIQLRVISWRCQASSVPGVTSRWARSAAGRRRANAARMARSVQSGLGPGDPTTEHRGFVPENHDLRVLVRLTAAEQRQPAEDPDHDQVEQAEGHELRSCRSQLVGANSGSQHERRVLNRYRQSLAVVSPSVIRLA
jgi:hypothetical protein